MENVDGEKFAMTSSGPLFCYKADISKDAYFWDNKNKDVTAPCCGMSEYVIADGLTFKFSVGTPAASTTPSKSTSGGYNFRINLQVLLGFVLLLLK